MQSIPFIDLKAQYLALRAPIQEQIQRVLDHGQYIMGPEVAELEKKLAEFVGCKHALAVSSGTDAALIALMALGVGPGDEVIVPAFSFIATAEVVCLTGATPVFVDVDPISYNLDPQKLQAALSDKTKVIQPVGLYGQPAAMKEINAFAKTHGLTVLEDAAQSFGATYGGLRSGHLSDIGVTSFFPAKPLGCYGDGGAIFTDRSDLAEAMAEIRTHGQKSRYHHTRIGINGRLDTLQCAILLPKLARFPWELEQRNKIAANFTRSLGELSSLGIVTPIVGPNVTSCWAQYTLQIPQRERVQKALQEKGIPTAVHYPSTMADQPAYGRVGRIVGDIEHSRRLSQVVLSLPMYPDMPPDLQDRIISSVLSVAREELR